MSAEAGNGRVDFDRLKAKQRSLREHFPTDFSLRIHRAISWFGRASDEPDDPDVRFILLWIGFNAAYARDVHADLANERGAFQKYFEALVGLDSGRRIYDHVWSRFPHEIRILLNNSYVFGPFWHHANGASDYADWEERMAKSQRLIGFALSQQNTALILSILFDRLYILRNQLVHGGATWKGSVNRNQVRDGAAILTSLVPIFIDLMMDHPGRDWGKPYYPVVENPLPGGA